MLSNKIINKITNDLENITQVKLYVIDNFGNEITPNTYKNIIKKNIEKFILLDKNIKILDEDTYFKVFINNELTYIIIAKGNSNNINQILKICANQIQNFIFFSNKKESKKIFIKNLILDNIPKIDIYNKAKNFNIKITLKRVVLLIETDCEKNTDSLELIQNIFNDKNDFISIIDEKHIVFLKTLKENDTYQDVFNISNVLLDMFNTELMLKTKISYGTIIEDLKDVSKSYKEAKMALNVCDIFYSEKNIIGYNSLGIGRIIYEIPIELCNKFIQEVFKDNVLDELDEEILATIYKFFENNLNISETARNIYIHRNTLVYRLEKLQKLTGLDVKKFDDALTFKIAIMINKYIKYIQKIYKK